MCVHDLYEISIQMCEGAFCLQVEFEMFITFEEGISSPQRVNWSKWHVQGHIAAKTGI